MYAYVSVDDNGNEGVIALQTQDGPMPLIVTDKQLAIKLKPAAVDVATRTNIKVRLIKFSDRETIELIDVK